MHGIRSLFIFALLFLASCGKREDAALPQTQVLRLNLHSEPPSLDPRRATDVTSVSIIKMFFEGLTRMGLSGKPELAAAERVSISSDEKVYTFTLRDALWSDGTPVTAYDFEKTWKTLLDPAFPCGFAFDLYFIKNAQNAKSNTCSIDDIGVLALDAKTLQIELEHPVPYLMSALSTHAFYPTPIHIVEKHTDWIKENYVGNGPFTLASWKHYHSIVAKKNENYWDKETVKLEKIHLAMIEDVSTELSMYDNHELDWAGYPISSLPEDAIPTLRKEGKLHTFLISGTYFYLFNTRKFPFNNANIRKAFSLAINRHEIVAHVTLSEQVPAMALIPPTMWDYHTPLFKDDDVGEAKRLLKLGMEELGIQELPPITLSYNTNSGHHKIAQAIQQQWYETFHIRVQLENKEWKVFLDEVRNHQYQIARMGGVASINDPSTFLDDFRYPTQKNDSGWYDPEFSELLEQADNTADATKRFTLLREAEKKLIDAMPIAPIYFYKGVYLKRPYVKDVYLSELNDVDFKWTYMENTIDRIPR